MDDISSTIGSILGDPAKMQQLRSVAESLGINTGNAPQGNTGDNSAQNNGFDPGAIAALLQNFQNAGGGQSGSPSNAANSGSSPNLDGLSKIASVLGSYNQSDKNVDLLRSLKPHFSAARATKIDDAVHIMQLMRMWPSLKDSGLLGSLGSFFTGGSGR